MNRRCPGGERTDRRPAGRGPATGRARDHPARSRSSSAAVLSLHGAGLGRLLNLLRDQEQVRAVGRRRRGRRSAAAARPPPGRRRDPDPARPRPVRPYLGSHAGGIDYLGLDDDGVVHLRLQGSCDGCPGSTATVRLTVENAVLDAAPEAVAVDVAGMVESTQTLLTIEPFRTDPPGRLSTSVDLVTPPGPGTAANCGRQRRAGRQPGRHVLCLPQQLPGLLVGPAPRRAGRRPLTCPRCTAAYDVRLAGRALAPEGHRHSALPLLPDGVRVEGRLPGGAAGVRPRRRCELSAGRACGGSAGRRSGRRRVSPAGATPRQEQCEMCAVPIGRSTRTWPTSGSPAALHVPVLLSAVHRRRRVARALPRRTGELPVPPTGFSCAAEWDAMGIPVNLAFLFYQSDQAPVRRLLPEPGWCHRVVARPGRAGTGGRG